MYEDLLIKTGLSLREIKIYTTLLNQGELMANELSKRTGLIRTNVYDIVNSLIKKGVVAYVIRNGKKYFTATEPEKLIDYINTQKKELEDVETEIKGILPKLKPANFNFKRPEIEVYEGKEGMKTILAMSVRESLKTKKEILGISVQQQKCRDLAGPYHIRWYNDREKYKIKSRYLMSAEEQIIPVKHTQFKILPQEAKNPNEIFIFGNITTQFFFIGNLFTAIVIKNKEITDNYRSYFDFLWKLVK
ncbi:MAG TPA: helix-turn-helix domain-containing protein [Candidatus Nanoarchaeia archaeon]|nr:helix-turn-helix domain-containing protein [Candidatus Nanoarchaeia archaeon]